MPLINLQTNLKSLKYGFDRPGGGSSNQPFIVKQDLDSIRTEDLGQTGGPDFILRGGTLTPTRIAEDTSRIFQLFTKTSTGLAFTAKQNLLSIVNTRIYGGLPDGGGLVTPRFNDGSYTPLSTLVAVAGAPLGYHPNKQGIDFTGTIEDLSRPQYLNLFSKNTNETEGIKNPNKNRLVNLYNTKLTDPNSDELYSFGGGPNSELGIGKTIIKKAEDTPSRFRGGRILKGYNPPEYNSKYATLSQESIQNRVVRSGVQPDFRKSLPNNTNTGSFISNSPTYAGPESKNIEQRVNLGDPGNPFYNRTSYTKGIEENKGGVDEINGLYLYKSANVTTSDIKNDLVKFRIATIDNKDPSQKIFAHFRAFINSFSDAMNASWDSFKYTGRGEDFYSYQGFTNSINMGFTVVAQSKQELSVMFQKLNYLKSTLSPDYSEQGYMRGNIHQLTVGGYFFEVPGIIDSLTYTIPNDTTWEIAINDEGGYDGTVKELPHRIEVDMTFKPIYSFLPETVKNIYEREGISQRFISLEDAIGPATNNLYADGVPPEHFAKEVQQALEAAEVISNNLP